MNPQRSSKMMWCRTFILMGGFVAALAGFGSGSIGQAGAKPIDADTPALSTVAEELPAEPAPAQTGPKHFVVASADPSQTIAIENPLVQAPMPSAPDAASAAIKPSVSTLEIPEDCVIADACINQYLWAFYQRTPKQDTNKVTERRKVTIKRKGKKVTVTRRFTKLVDADFTWKDPKAAEKAGMPMMNYVIGGMDRVFKTRLLYMLVAAEQAGLAPGITSAFRDDYRQSIASGQKAASDRSYHGGSLRGGFGHGLAADVVGVNGATRAQRWVASDRLWKWIDEHGKEFGIGRPYLDRDAPHVGPIDGQEYATHYRPPKIQQAKADAKKGDQPATRIAPALTVISMSEINARRDQ